MTEPSQREDCSLEALVGQVADEFLRRRREGERPTAEEYLARYPQAAGLLRDVLASLELFDGSLGGSASSPAGAPEPALPGTLGDFRIVREVGRGGMGVVYEAEQLSLGRRVALKVLPFAATLDPRQLTRFHNEARAAANLHHEHVVPVYFVGSERGVHFFAMQFVDGMTLAELIARQRQPTTTGGGPAEGRAPAAETVAAAGTEPAPRDRAYFRRVAGWGVEAAEALEHAHALGVVHRDVKPGNLMLDSQGKLWVTDFGLARTPSDAGLTLTGDLVGTLRYMSPEQALARHGLVDHRTDVYSLGATLYELLAGAPAVDGKDRQEVLHNIAFAEPKRLRQGDRSVPADLETVVLRALAKEPAERYQSARELADDLRRWLEDRPIKARRPTLMQRARKWARRRRGAVASAAVAALVSLAALAGCLGWLARDRQARRKATEALVDEALRESEAQGGQGKWAEAVGAARRARGLLEGGPADEGLRRRVDERLADLDLVARLEGVRLEFAVTMGKGPSGFAWVGESYAAAFRGYGIDVDELDPDEAGRRLHACAVRAELAAALVDWALHRRVTPRRGRRCWRELLELACVADPDEWRDRVRHAMARQDRKALAELARSEQAGGLPPATQAALGRALRETGAPEEAAAFLRQAQRRHPEDFWINFELGDALGDCRPPRHAEAVRFFAIALALRPRSLAARVNLGASLYRAGALDEAVAVYREAIAKDPDSALAHFNLAAALREKGDLGGAIRELREVLRVDPAVTTARLRLALALKDKGDLDGAIREFREVIRVKKDDPDAFNNLGAALALKGNTDEAVAALREATRLAPKFAAAQQNLGLMLVQKGRPGEAADSFRKALKVNPGLAISHLHLGLILKARGDAEEAVASLREAARLAPADFDAHHALGQVLCDQLHDYDGALAAFRRAIALRPGAAVARCNLGLALMRKGLRAEALAAFDEALGLDADFAPAWHHLGRCLVQMGWFREGLACLRRGHDLSTRQTYWPYPSGDWVRAAERLLAREADLEAVLEGRGGPADPARAEEYAECCQFKGLHAGAARLYREAFAARPGLAADPQSGTRYEAARSAALAGCGRGKDASRLTPAEQAGWRRQALAWLRAELAWWRRRAEGPPGPARAEARERLRRWRADPALAGVRDGAALARLPEPERRAWRHFWAEVERSLGRAPRPAGTADAG
jgi:eukaryotic-like serine/threonine-protein kinase